MCTRFLSFVASTFLASACLAADPAVYERDVDFLLTECEKLAGHFFPRKGIDWPRVSEDFHKQAKEAKTDSEFIKLVGRLLARLRDGHAGIVESKVQMPDESNGRRYTGPRVHLVTIGEKLYVRAAFGDAEQRGIKPGMEVLRIDSKPAREWLDARVQSLGDDRGYSTRHQAIYAASHWGLADWEGTRITFELRDAAAEKGVAITRNGGPNYAPFGPVFPPKDLKTAGRQSYGKTAGGFGYIHLRDVPGDLPAQLDAMLEAIGDVPGLILDTRANGGGGCDHEAVFGRFLSAGEKWRQYTGQGKRPFTGPMVVIVDAGVRSAGETIAGIFSEDGRAYMIGDSPTAGMSSQKRRFALPSGLATVSISVASNKGRFNGGKGIEGIGVPPMEVTPYDPADLLAGIDTQIRRAEELLKAGLPKNKVPYEAARKPADK